MNCFICQMERALKTCLDRISQNKTNSTDINMSKRKPANEFHQMLPCYEGKYVPRQNSIDFEPARKNLVKEDDKMVVRRRFERTNIMIACKSYIKFEDIPENKGIFVYGFQHIKTDKIDNHILFGCELDVLYENSKLCNFWSNKFINKEIEKRDFKITGWCYDISQNN